MVTSREARDYKHLVAVHLLGKSWNKIPKPIDVAISIEWMRDRAAGDLDKRLGVLLDALQGLAYDSDSQITYIRAIRLDVGGGGCVRVEVWPHV